MILIANIGNRNIRYKNQYFNSKLPEFSSFGSFRGFTRHLLEHFDAEKEHIEPQIIPDIFRHLETTPRLLILFYSDSPEGIWNEQDTIYEASILEKKLTEDNPGLEVLLMPLKCRVTDTNELMKRYRGYVKLVVRKALAGEQIVLCDAGGTPQQKSALKIIVEYLLDDSRYSVYNVNFAGAERLVEKTESVEYRKVITQEQIVSLVDSGNYRGAQSIYGLNQQYNHGVLNKALEIAACLFEINLNRACTLSAQECFGKKDSAEWPIFRALSDRSFYDEGENNWMGMFTREQLFALRVILEVARINEANRQYGFAVLFHHVFIEQALSYLLSSQTGLELDEKEGWDRLKKRIVSGESFAGVAPPWGDSWAEIQHPSIPVKIALAGALELPGFSGFVDSFKNMNSVSLRKTGIERMGLDQLRNKFAHEGRTIHESDYEDFKPRFAEWYRWLQMDKKNLFLALNRCIGEMLEK